jgi:hypothetical protein
MSTFLEQKELFNQVLRLREEEKRNPMIVIERFFDDYRLYECRHYLWIIVETCLTADSTLFDDAEERANLLLRYKDLEKFLEAASLLLLQSRPAKVAEKGK